MTKAANLAAAANATAGNITAAKVQNGGVTTNALAWVNFNGTNTVAIRSSYNVSSITDNGTGDYTLNFTTALSDANYCSQVVWGNGSSRDWGVQTIPGTATTTTLRVYSSNATTGVGGDEAVINVLIFGN